MYKTTIEMHPSLDPQNSFDVTFHVELFTNSGLTSLEGVELYIYPLSNDGQKVLFTMEDSKGFFMEVEITSDYPLSLNDWSNVVNHEKANIFEHFKGVIA